MKSKCLLVFLLFILPFILIGQFSSPIHYTVKDGLPSSTTYSAAQDAKGYMWIGTEAGLVRFDGTNFKTYTTQDGLPDNEILSVTYDSLTDRLWIISYSKSACYFKNGKFYTSHEDSSLTAIKCEFGEFVNGNIQQGVCMFLYNAFTLYKCTNKITKTVMDGEGILYAKQWNDSVTDVIFTRGVLRCTPSSRTYYKGFGLDSVNSKGKWIGDKLFLYRIGRISVYSRLRNGSYTPVGEIKMNVEKEVANVIRVGNKYFIGIPGSRVCVIDTSLNDTVRTIWSGSYNDISTDQHGNIWVMTNDDGIYIISNNGFVNYNAQNGLFHDNLTCLYSDKTGTIYVGNTYGELSSINNGTLAHVKTTYHGNIEKIRAIGRKDDKIYIISNHIISYFDIHSGRVKLFPHISGGPKSFLITDSGRTILVGLLATIMKIDTKTDQVKELAFYKRIIDIAQHPDGRIFCASLDGLYFFINDTLQHIDHPDIRLNGRITSLCFTKDSLLWIGTPANGVLVYDGTRVLTNVSQSKYLGYRGAICRKVVCGKPSEIWVATNFGINKIKYHLADSLVIDNITPLNMADGLCSDDVNDILVDDSLIYVATSQGLTIFNENQMIAASLAPIYVSAIHINDKDSVIHDGEYNLNYQQNNLKIEYIGVALPSAGYLRYQYRLLGSGNDKWTNTTNTSIEFRSLSAGSYIFEAVVLDKFGNKSKSLARVKFHISPAFYMTIWFWTLIVILVLVTGFYIIRARFQRQQRQFQKEQGLNNKIIELEQQALKAQMNPHFIFNCLTSVQHFVNKEDLYSANMYLSNFAKLIRKTLDLSGEQYISLDKEVSYLENYVQLEKMRFQEKFQYTITVDEDIDEFSVQIPPMLLQPIIENAIRHGLRNKDTDTGMLKVHFSQEGEKIICTVDDNGIGMKKAKELKTLMHVEYQSKGMSLTTSRIQAINMISDKKISIEFKDKYENDQAVGTIVVLTFEQ